MSWRIWHTNNGSHLAMSYLCLSPRAGERRGNNFRIPHTHIRQRQNQELPEDRSIAADLFAKHLHHLGAPNPQMRTSQSFASTMLDRSILTPNQTESVINTVGRYGGSMIVFQLLGFIWPANSISVSYSKLCCRQTCIDANLLLVRWKVITGTQESSINEWVCIVQALFHFT